MAVAVAASLTLVGLRVPLLTAGTSALPLPVIPDHITLVFAGLRVLMELLTFLLADASSMLPVCVWAAAALAAPAVPCLAVRASALLLPVIPDLAMRTATLLLAVIPDLTIGALALPGVGFLNLSVWVFTLLGLVVVVEAIGTDALHLSVIVF